VTKWRHMKQKLKTGDEFDVVCSRGWYTYLKRAGVASKIKRRLRRRLRHEWREECPECGQVGFHKMSCDRGSVGD